MPTRYYSDETESRLLITFNSNERVVFWYYPNLFITDANHPSHAGVRWVEIESPPWGKIFEDWNKIAVWIYLDGGDVAKLKRNYNDKFIK